MAIPIVMAVGAAVAAYSAYQQGQTAKKAAKYNAAVQRQNAEATLTQSRANAAQIQRQNVLRLGLIRANIGASGGTGEGSAMDVIGDVAAQGELERQNELYRGELASRGHTNTATLDEYQGTAAGRAGALGAGQELLRGGAGAAGAYYRLR
jgi:hypothetical protein